MPRRKIKYEKVMTNFWRCVKCNFEQAYVTVRCPICSSQEFTKVR